MIKPPPNKPWLTAGCAALALLLAAPAVAQQSTPPQQSNAVSLNPQDRAFLAEATLNGLAEVEFAKTAQSKAAGDSVKAFAQAMIDDHGKANDRLRQLARSKGIPLPHSINAADAARLKSLKTLDGAAFDYRYMGGQEEMHEAAVRRFEEEFANGQDPEIQKFARDTLPTLLNHLMSAKVITYELALGNPRLVKGGMMQNTGSAGQTIVNPNNETAVGK